MKCVLIISIRNLHMLDGIVADGVVLVCCRAVLVVEIACLSTVPYPI